MESRVFDKEWFKKHQRVLIWVARSWLGPIIFRWKKMGHYVDRKLLVKITPNSIAEFVSYKDGQIELREHFFCRNEYARKLYWMLLPMWWGMHIWDLLADNLLPQYSFGFTTLTVNPDVGTGLTTVDGEVKQFFAQGSGVTWGTLQGSAGNGTTPSGTSMLVYYQSDNVSGHWVEMRRCIFTWDTSSIGAGQTISSAILSVNFIDKQDDFSASPTFDIYTSTPAANNNLANGDFTQIGTVSQTGAAKTYASIGAGYNDFTFNATGIGNIAMTGISKFGMREANHDVANVSPTWISTPLNGTYFDFTAADAGANKPKLVITYSSGGNVVHLLALMGLGK